MSRAELVTRARADIARNSSRFTYGEVRPIPLAAYKAGKPVRTDCSGWYDCLAYATPGCPNPFGGPWTGAGNTETLLAHLPKISLAAVLPGDCVVYGGPIQLQHVAVFLQAGAAHPNPLIGSFGSQGGPREMPLADETAGHPGQPVYFLRLAIPDTPARVWHVRTLAGDPLGDTKHPVAWAVRHPRSFRRHRVVFDWKGTT